MLSAYTAIRYVPVQCVHVIHMDLQRLNDDVTRSRIHERYNFLEVSRHNLNLESSLVL